MELAGAYVSGRRLLQAGRGLAVVRMPQRSPEHWLLDAACLTRDGNHELAFEAALAAVAGLTRLVREGREMAA